MTVKLRLMRMGKKKQPTYRIVATDSRSPRDGRFIEIVGTYAPRSEPSVVQVDNSKALRWLEHGAQPTDTVRKLLTVSGAWAEFESQKGAGRPATATKAAAPAKPAKATAKPAKAAAGGKAAETEAKAEEEEVKAVESADEADESADAAEESASDEA